MPDEPIAGTSSPVTEEDTRRRGIVGDMILAQNKSVVDFAKHLVTISFSAIGVVLTLKEKWVTGRPDAQRATLLLGISIAVFLVAVVLASAAIQVYRLRVSGADYDDVEAELGRIARRRYTLTMAAAGLCIIAAAMVAITVL